MKVLAGDWKGDATVTVKKSFTGKWQELWLPAGMWKMDKLPLADIADFQVVTEENKASILGKVGWGAAGLVALGPLGLLAGVLGGGNKRDRVMAIRFRDGRSALIKGNAGDVEALMAATFNSKSSDQQKLGGPGSDRIEPSA